jgi:CBS domain containing-hemolysin-like protein
MAAVLLADAEVHWAWDALGLLTVPALVALNGFFVAAEFALVAVRKTQVAEMVRQGVRGARAVQDAVNHLDHSIAATQLGITLASIALGWAAEPALARLLESLFLAVLPGAWAAAAAHLAAVGLALFLITFLHVVFGELIPKTLALQAPDRASLWVAGPLRVFSRLTRPVVLLMNGTGNAILRRCGYRPAGTEGLVHSVGELSLLIEGGRDSGALSGRQADLVQKVFRLSGKQVKDCLVPRERVAALELRAPQEQILEAVRRGAHTRMPVYEGELDAVVGIINTKDLFHLFSLKGLVVLEDALYPPLFLRPEADVADALELFRGTRRPMAVVREDGGKVLGLITMEDVLEEIVGEIEDEHDRPAAGRARAGRRPPAGPDNDPHGR